LGLIFKLVGLFFKKYASTDRQTDRQTDIITIPMDGVRFDINFECGGYDDIPYRKELLSGECTR